MKAVLCKDLGPPENLVLEEVASPEPEDNEIIIKVKACGVNFPDTLIIQGKYQFQPPLPFSPGGEVAGVVIKTGRAVDQLKVGDRVMAGTSWGGFAEEARSLASNAFVIPESMGFEQAAASLMTYGTSYHALVDRARIRESETLLVLGAAGGVGTAAIQIAKTLGCQVIAAASTDEKLAYCKRIGADYLINYSSNNLKEEAKRLTNGRGVDVVFDPVGGVLSESAFRAIARGGRHLVVGFASGEIPKLPWNLPLLKSAAIVGVFWGGFFRNEPDQNRANIEQLLNWFDSSLIKSHIYQQLPLDNVAEALNLLLNQKVNGKVILTP